MGGNDDIRVGNGDNIVLGGFGTDVIVTGIRFGPDPWRQRQVHVHDDGWGDDAHARGDDDLVAGTGDGDMIVTGGGTTQNIVLAGMGADRVNGRRA